MLDAFIIDRIRREEEARRELERENNRPRIEIEISDDRSLPEKLPEPYPTVIIIDL